MKIRLVRPLVIIASVVFLLAAAGSAHAFWGKRKETKPVDSKPKLPKQHEKRIGDVRVFEQAESMVLFSVYPITGSKDSDATKSNFLEIGYKLVDRGTAPGTIFGANGWLEIRFEDQDGFHLMAAPVHFESPKREYYGFVRIDPAKAKQIARIEVKPLKASEIPAPPPSEPAVEIKPSAAPVIPVPPPAPLPPAPIAAEPVTAPAAQAPETPQATVPDKTPEGAQEVITNAVIQKRLEEVDKAKPADGAAPIETPPATPKENPS